MGICKQQWLVKDADGEYVSIFANNWTCGGDGLRFTIGEKEDMETIAWFLSWNHFRKIGKS